MAETLAGLVKNNVRVVGFSLSGDLYSLKDVFMLGPLHNIGAGHVVRHLCGVLVPLANAMEAASDAAQATNHNLLGGVAAVPHMSEFVDFLRVPKAQMLRKKRWP